MQVFEVEKLASNQTGDCPSMSNVTMEDLSVNDGQMSQYGQMCQRICTIGGAGATGGTTLSKSAGFK